MTVRRSRSGAMPWWITSQEHSNDTQEVDVKKIIVVEKGKSQSSQNAKSQPNQQAAQTE